MIFLGVFRYFRGKHLEMWTFPLILVSLNTLWHLQIASYTFKDFPQVHLETTIFPTYTWRFPSVSQNIRRIRIFSNFIYNFSPTLPYFPRYTWRLQSFLPERCGDFNLFPNLIILGTSVSCFTRYDWNLFCFQDFAKT